MRHRIALLVAPLLLLAMLPGAVSAAPNRDARAEHRAAVLAYWTPARIKLAAAHPRDFSFDAVRGFHPDKGKPGGGGGGGGGPTSVTGASWTGGGKMLLSTGKVLFTMDGSDWICSGSVVNDGGTNNGHSVVLTAGHCVTDNTANSFATNWMFIPQFDTTATYDCASAVQGCWVADALYASTAFATAGGFNDTAVQNDWGFARVTTGNKFGQLDATAGSFPIQYSSGLNGQVLSAFGYPAAGKYHGYDLTYCRGPIGQDSLTSNTTWAMACDMTGGSSGGPWVQTTNYTTYEDAVLSSLNSYGYSGVKNMYGPKFNTRTQAVFNAANAGGTPAGGSGVSWSDLP
jgi:hypothetical protein